LDVYLTVLEGCGDVATESHVEVGGDFLAEGFGVEGKDFEI
jgi:hypothetical protein